MQINGPLTKMSQNYPTKFVGAALRALRHSCDHAIYPPVCEMNRFPSFKMTVRSLFLLDFMAIYREARYLNIERKDIN